MPPTDQDPNPATKETPETTATPAVETPPEELDVTATALKRLGFVLDDELPPDETPPETPEGDGEGEGTGDANPPGSDDTPPENPEETPTAPETPAAEEPRKTVKRKAPPPAPLSAADIARAVAEALGNKGKPEEEVRKPIVADPEESLPEYDREELSLARFAAEVMPDKYKGMDQKYLSYLQKRDAKIAEIIKEEGEFDPQSEDFQKFVREHRPNFQGTDRQKVIKEQVKRETLSEADKRLQEREKKWERKIRELEVGPTIPKKLNEVQEYMLDLDDEAVKQFKSDPAKAADNNPIETPLIEGAVRDVAEMTKEYLRVANGLTDPSDDNPVHGALANFISHQGKLLDAIPEDKRVRADGRILVSRERMHQLVQSKSPQVASYCTFDDDMVVDMLREFGKQSIKTRLAETRARLEKAGFKRTVAAPVNTPAPTGAEAAAKPAAPVAQKPKPPQPPKAGASPTPPPPVKGGTKTVAPHLKALGITSDVD